MNVQSSSIYNIHKQKQIKCPLTDGCINMWWFHTTEYYMAIYGHYMAIKRGEILIQAAPWMNLENITLRERS